MRASRSDFLAILKFIAKIDAILDRHLLLQERKVATFLQSNAKRDSIKTQSIETQ